MGGSLVGSVRGRGREWGWGGVVGVGWGNINKIIHSTLARMSESL